MNNSASLPSKTTPRDRLRRRGFLLSAWLVVVMIVYGILAVLNYTAVTNPLAFSQGMELTPPMVQLYSLTMTLVCMAGVVGAVTVWWLRRWGLWLIILTTGLALVLNIIVGASDFFGVVAVGMIVITVILVWPKRKMLT
jgi:hypothetical protein